MRLIDPGLGELVDRLTILDLKYEHSRGQRVEHLVKERHAIAERLANAQNHPLSTSALFVALQEALAQTNADLWHAEDRVRLLRRCDAPIALPIVACEIQQLNDQRALLVRLLNIAAGTDVGPEKLR